VDYWWPPLLSSSILGDWMRIFSTSINRDEKRGRHVESWRRRELSLLYFFFSASRRKRREEKRESK